MFAGELEQKHHTRHPDPTKRGVRISLDKFERVRAEIEGVLVSEGDLTHTELPNAVGRRLRKSFDGSVPWYVTMVKLDMEAGGRVQRVPNTRPARLGLRPSDHVEEPEVSGDPEADR